MKSIVVLYHANCPDGFGAAYAAWRKFGGRAEYIAVNPDTLPKKTLRNREIYALDISYSKKVLEKLKKENKSIVVIDHHITSKDAIKHASSFVFDIKHSAAILAWRYFQPKKSVPWLLRYIEDYDLWKFKIPDTKVVAPYIHMQKRDFRIWTGMMRRLETKKGRGECKKAGKLIYDYGETLIASLEKKAIPVIFENKKVFVVNSSASELADRLLHRLLKKIPPFSAAWYETREEIKVSLRSDGKFDVSKLAIRYGGGGHKAAAGFSLPRKAKLPWKPIKN